MPGTLPSVTTPTPLQPRHRYRLFVYFLTSVVKTHAYTLCFVCNVFQYVVTILLLVTHARTFPQPCLCLQFVLCRSLVLILFFCLSLSFLTPFLFILLLYSFSFGLFSPVPSFAVILASVLNFQARLRNFEKTISFVMFVCWSVVYPFVRPHGTTRLPLDVF
jgi:hypothetical protein